MACSAARAAVASPARPTVAALAGHPVAACSRASVSPWWWPVWAGWPVASTSCRRARWRPCCAFGQFRYLTNEAGIQWNLPYPIESHEIVDRSRLRQIEVGYRTSVRNKVSQESLILTGDQSIVDLQYAVQYRIDNPGDFLFQNNLSSGSEELIRQVAESAMREVVGQRTTDQVLYEDKAQVAEDAQTLTQAILDRYKLGIGIVDFTIQQASRPSRCRPPSKMPTRPTRTASA